MVTRLIFFSDIINSFSYFKPYLLPDKNYAFLVLLGIVGIAVSNTALIWYLGVPFDILASGDYSRLVVSLMTLIVIILVNQVLLFWSTLASNWIGLRFVGRVRQEVLARFMVLSIMQANRYSKGDLLARMSHDVDKTQNLFIELPFFLVSHLTTALLYCLMLFWIDWQLALLAFLLSPFFLWHQQFFGKRKKQAAAQFLKKNGTLLAYEEKTLTHLRGINAFDAAKQIKDGHEKSFAQAFRWAMKERWLDVAFSSSFSFLIYFVGLIVIYAGVKSIQAGDLSLGALVSFLLYLGYSSVPVRGIAQAPFQAQADLAAAHRVIEPFKVTSSIVNDTCALQPLKVTQGSITFSDVTFAYDECEPLFRHLDFTIAGGKTVAIVGRSGVGKTTLAHLLMRFYDPSPGTICIDGQDLQAVSIESIRKHIAIVWQGPVIIYETVRENLLLAKPNASEQELVQACEMSHCWEFIQQWSLGLDTLIGDRGQFMSTGQMQRFSLAQVFLRDPKILVLDEVSSALDSQTEKKIINVIHQLSNQRTTIIIAHRYASIRAADYIIYLNDDGSMSQGTHHDLLTHHVAYREAVRWQFGEQAVS